MEKERMYLRMVVSTLVSKLPLVNVCMYVCKCVCVLLFVICVSAAGHWTDNDIDIKGRFDFANGSYYRGMPCIYVCMYVWMDGFVKITLIA